MGTYMSNCLNLLQSILDAVVQLFSNEWFACCFMLVIIAFVVHIFGYLTNKN